MRRRRNGHACLEEPAAALLIADVSLVGRMTGIELAERARRINPQLRIIVVSGQTPALALPDGVTFLAKPLHPIELLREVGSGWTH